MSVISELFKKEQKPTELSKHAMAVELSTALVECSRESWHELRENKKERAWGVHLSKNSVKGHFFDTDISGAALQEAAGCNATFSSLSLPTGVGNRSPQLRLLSRPRPDIGPSLAASSSGSACAASAPAIFCPGPAARPHRGFFCDVARPGRFGPRSPRRNRWRRPRRDPRFSLPPPLSRWLFPPSLLVRCLQKMWRRKTCSSCSTIKISIFITRRLQFWGPPSSNGTAGWYPFCLSLKLACGDANIFGWFFCSVLFWTPGRSME
ncbi:uncharacterized protein LOC120311430 [Crotalus tigris]|uniref:uncharacterized protein LOC120311430 n=1 Tax=Crotalus tigris TaxID=88082 RepID=UPI00192F11DD|nr:uncharacterized protein LOC120311430 [Crotalus tigris]